METDYPALEHLAQAYFHQDWPDEYADPVQVVDAFLTGTPSLAPLVADEVERALLAHVNESDARHFVLDQLDASYLVERDGLTYRGWLQSIADRARELGH